MGTPVLTRKGLTQAAFTRFGGKYTQVECEQAVAAVFETLQDLIKQRVPNINIPGFGTFRVFKRKGIRGYQNPRTLEKGYMPCGWELRFRPAKVFRRYLRQGKPFIKEPEYASGSGADGPNLQGEDQEHPVDG